MTPEFRNKLEDLLWDVQLNELPVDYAIDKIDQMYAAIQQPSPKPDDETNKNY